MNAILKKIRQSDAFNKENRIPYIKAIAMMGIFTFIFLGAEYLFVNMISRTVSADRAVAAQNYALGVSTLGFLIYPLFNRLCREKLRAFLTVVGAAASVACIFGIYYINGYSADLCLGLMLFLLFGIFGNAVFYRALCLIESNKHIARLVGLSYMLGVLLQFVNNNLIRTEKAETVLLSAFLALLAVVLIKAENNSVFPAFSENAETDKAPNKSFKSAAVVGVLALLVVLMTGVFSTLDNAVTLYHANGTANIGNWPRILLAVSGIVSGFLFDIKQRKFMSIIMYCVMILSTICIAVLEFSGPFLTGLVIFYVSAGFFAVFFTASFMEIARYTKSPDLWAGLGRAINNAVAVCITGGSLSLLSSENSLVKIVAVLVLFVAVSVAAAIYTFKRKAFFDEINAENDAALSNLEKLKKLSEEFSLTPRETEVFGQLVSTEDSIQVIADNMYVSRRTLERYISAINEKTGAKSRVGLVCIYNK